MYPSFRKYNVLFKYVEQLFIGAVVFLKLGQLLSARAEGSCGGIFKQGEVLFVFKLGKQVDKSFLKQALYTVFHSVYLTYIFTLKRASYNARKSCVYRRSRTARLTDKGVSDKACALIFHISAPFLCADESASYE